MLPIQSLGVFVRERIFDPLGMKDTGFHISPETRDRIPAFYLFNRQTNRI